MTCSMLARLPGDLLPVFVLAVRRVVWTASDERERLPVRRVMGSLR